MEPDGSRSSFHRSTPGPPAGPSNGQSFGALAEARRTRASSCSDRGVRAPLRNVTAQSTQRGRSEEHTSELQSRFDLVCRLLLEKKNKKSKTYTNVTST